MIRVCPKRDALDALLKRHGVDDADAYLEKHGDQVEVARSPDPDVHMYGNVQLMLNRKISRKEVDEGLKRLKHV